MDNKELNKARAVYYGVFSRFFVYSKDTTEYFQLRDTLKTLSKNPLDKTSKEALDSILEKLDSTSNVTLLSEFDDIFYNPTSSTIRTSASFYDEGVESGKKRVEMQQFLGKTKIRRNEEKFTEYEDHFGFVFTVMSELSTLISNGEENYQTL
ncbi:MAG: molecular chaperone TorD family protein, partial [Campylobacterales bacterium]|nr:molecular chaperone TorD family protein [Campylobacterales bacterium]